MLDLEALLEEACTVRRDLDDLTVRGEDGAAGLAQERGHIRGKEVLAVTETDDERRLLPDADEHVRVVVMDRHDREVALETGVHADERLDELALVLLLEHVHDDFRVGLRPERVTFGDQLLA